MARTISLGNWTSYIQDFTKDKDVALYTFGKDGAVDPAPGCDKSFFAFYKCGSDPKWKTIILDKASTGSGALFDCSTESKACSGFRLTLGDDGNLVLTDAANKQIWTSNTKKTGLAMDEFKAAKGKYGRNYLLAGEVLGLGEFMGSPSGNCYLIMDKGPGGNGLQLNYSVLNCNEQNFGNDENTNGLFSLAKTAYNEMIGQRNKIEPKMAALSKENPPEDQLFVSKTKQMKEDVHDYMGFRQVRPVLEKHIKQLDAMHEDTGLLITRYKYRRIAWLTLAILILLGGMKMMRNNSS
jgi:hypothetical protein